jgi:hypothetical protein
MVLRLSDFLESGRGAGPVIIWNSNAQKERRSEPSNYGGCKRRGSALQAR